MSLLTMREVMKLTGATESALRYYNKKCVVSPTVREDSGRRQWLYDEEAVEKIRRLQLLKYIGIPVGQIRQAIEDEEYFGRVLEEALESLEQERQELDRRLFVARIVAAAGGTEPFVQSSAGRSPSAGDPEKDVMEQALERYIRRKEEEE